MRRARIVTLAALLVGSGAVYAQDAPRGAPLGRYLKILQRTGCVQLPPGDFYVRETIEIPSGGRLAGCGYRTRLHAVGDFPVIRFRAVHDAAVENVRITHGGKGLRSLGVLVRGTDLLIRRLWIEDCLNAVEIETVDAQPSRRITLRQVRCSHSNPTAATSQFGLNANTVDGLLVDECHWRDAWLDGVKLRRRCRNVVLRGGSSSDNGRSLGHGASGDGIDCFPGGDTVTIDGTLFERNGGNAVVIKTVGDTFQPAFGRPRQFLVTHAVCRDNRAGGIVVEGVYDSTSDKQPRLANAAEDLRARAYGILVSGCIVENNDNEGIVVNGLSVSVTDTLLRANGREGIRIAENARDVLVRGCHVLGCSAAEPGARPAVTVEGGAARVRFESLVMIGKERTDTTDVVSDATYADLETLHRNGIEVQDGATDVHVAGCRNLFVTSDAFAAPVVSFQKSGVLVLEHVDDEPTPVNRYFGGLGSTYRSTANGTFWVKESGPPNSKAGWVLK